VHNCYQLHRACKSVGKERKAVIEYSTAAIGKRLESGLVDKGISFKELATAVSVTEDVVKNWVSGRTRIPIDKACAICDLFEWPMDRLAVRGEWDDQKLSAPIQGISEAEKQSA